MTTLKKSHVRIEEGEKVRYFVILTKCQRRARRIKRTIEYYGFKGFTSGDNVKQRKGIHFDYYRIPADPVHERILRDAYFLASRYDVPDDPKIRARIAPRSRLDRFLKELEGREQGQKFKRKKPVYPFPVSE